MSPQPSSLSPLTPQTVAIPLLASVNAKSESEANALLKDKKSRWIDVAITGGIIGLLLALLVPMLGKQELVLPNVKQSLVEHLRFTRAGAVSRGAHFRVSFQDHAYVIQQLQDSDGDGVWTTDAALPIWRIALPTTVVIEAEGIRAVEFDNRGLVTHGQNQYDGMITIHMRDIQNGRSATIRILPSGQVQET